MAAMLAPGARPTNALTDLIFCAYMVWLLTRWSREWHRARSSLQGRLFFFSYASVLCGCGLFALVGAYIHCRIPLPSASSGAWLLYLMAGGIFPVSWPLGVYLGFHKKLASWQLLRAGCIALAAYLAYAAAAASGVDVSTWDPTRGGKQLAPWPVCITPWHCLDGRSYGGEAHGVEFDLLTSLPCWRCDSYFFLGVFYCTSILFASLLLLWRPAHNAGPIWSMLATNIMTLLNVGYMMPVWVLLFGTSIPTAIDFFHIIQCMVCEFGQRSMKAGLPGPGDADSSCDWSAYSCLSSQASTPDRAKSKPQKVVE